MLHLRRQNQNFLKHRFWWFLEAKSTKPVVEKKNSLAAFAAKELVRHLIRDFFRC
jgi:hypothetical protein